MKTNFADFIENTFKVIPRNQDLYKQALTHRSYLNETKDKNLKSFERLEFLGDAVLELYISRLIYEKYPDFSEGDMTNLRSNVVKTETLAYIASQIKLGGEIFLSKGEEESDGRQNDSILADCFEALIAAIFLDTSMDSVSQALNNYFPLIIKQKYEKTQLKDNKSLLQEATQEKYKSSPDYLLLKSEGPDHHKFFTIGVKVNGKTLGRGQGYSKQKAEEAAAKLALEKIGK